MAHQPSAGPWGQGGLKTARMLDVCIYKQLMCDAFTCGLGLVGSGL